MKKVLAYVTTGFVLTTSLVSCTKFFWWRKEEPSKLQEQSTGQSTTPHAKLVWMSLDGFQPTALEPWMAKLKSPHPKGLAWLLNKANGRSDFRVINPTITAPSHIATFTCSGAGALAILDNNTWTGSGTTSGFNKPYAVENWVSRLRKQGFKVASSLYPSMDGSTTERQADLGIAYDNPGSQPQILTLTKGATLAATIPDRSDSNKKHPIELTANAAGVVSVKTPWGQLDQLTLAKPEDIFFSAPINGSERRVAVSFLLLTSEPQITVLVSPIEVMPVMGPDLVSELERNNIIFSSLRDYRIQSNLAAYLATMDHRRQQIVAANLLMLKRTDIDAMFLYFEDLDTLLHAFYKDDDAASMVVDYLDRFDQDLGRMMDALPTDAELVVVGDHGMSAIKYVMNARKILTEVVASKGTVMAGGGALYLYPPQGDIAQEPPQDLDLNAVATTLRDMDLDLTGAKLFGKVIIRGSKEAQDEGLSGDQVPWIMAFANDGVAFKNSVEDKILLARAKWAPIPESLRSKYPEPLNNGKLLTPIPAGQHGHWNEIAEMRTRVVLEGRRLAKFDAQSIDRTLQLLPAVADTLGLPRPASCAK